MTIELSKNAFIELGKTEDCSCLAVIWDGDCVIASFINDDPQLLGEILEAGPYGHLPVCHEDGPTKPVYPDGVTLAEVVEAMYQ